MAATEGLPVQKGWVRLLVEPVEVPIDEHGCVNFATVQSVVPGAHGLYFREAGQRRALGFDTNTGKVSGPVTGWESEQIYVHLAHGHGKHGVHYADYTKASAQFEKNVSAVQRLIAAAGLGYAVKKGADGKPVPRDGSKRVPRAAKSGFEAQPEQHHAHSDESDQSALEERNREIARLQRDNQNLTDRLREVEQQQAEAAQQVHIQPAQASPPMAVSSSSGKKKKGKGGQSAQPAAQAVQVQKQPESPALSAEIARLEKVLGETQTALTDAQLVIMSKDEELAALKQQQQTPAPEGEDVLALRTRLAAFEAEREEMIQLVQNEQLSLISAKDEHISQLADQLDATRGELEMANARSTALCENMLRMEYEIGGLSKTLQEERDSINNKVQEFTDRYDEESNNLHELIAELRQSVGEERHVKEVAEWHLGEHREWLRVATEKIGYLETELQRVTSEGIEKNEKIDQLYRDKDAAQREVERLSHEPTLDVTVLQPTQHVKKEEVDESVVAVLQAQLENTQKELSARVSADDLAMQKEHQLQSALADRSSLLARNEELYKECHEAKWRLSEAESEAAHQREAAERAQHRLREMREDVKPNVARYAASPLSLPSYGNTPVFGASTYQPSSSVPSHSGTYVIRREGGVETMHAQPWRAGAWPAHAPPQPDYRRMWIDIEADGAESVFLMGSFVNWECALRCEDNGAGRRGVYVDLPRGRYEFRFLVDGRWVTAANYPRSRNDQGTENNWIFVE